jgi:hypothetical protein
MVITFTMVIITVITNTTTEVTFIVVTERVAASTQAAVKVTDRANSLTSISFLYYTTCRK